MGCVQTREYYKQGVAGLLFQISLHTRQKVSWRGGTVVPRETFSDTGHRALQTCMSCLMLFEMESILQYSDRITTKSRRGFIGPQRPLPVAIPYSISEHA